MNKRKKHIDFFISMTLVFAIIISMFMFSLPAVSAAESYETETGQELAGTGANHRTVSYDGVPDVTDDNILRNVPNIYLNKNSLYLNVYESFQLNVLDAYSKTINGRIAFTSSDTSVAAIAASGNITAKRTGMAIITATDRVSGTQLSCSVYIGAGHTPTETPIPKPTQAPTQKPTQAPTQKPTQAPTQKPTQAPTQKPTQAPTTAPTNPPAAETLSINAASATVYKGCYYHVVATSNTAVSFKSSNTSVATVNSQGVVTALAAGTVTITASTSTKSASCKLTVKAGSSVNISQTKASVNRFMTFLMTSSTSGVKWTSSDTSVATVKSDGKYGFIYGVKAGTAVITVSNSSGAATCLMTVEPSHSVRFAYASPNCAAKNQTVTLVCVTDTMRTGVRFAVDMGSSVKYVNATSRVKENDTYVWKGTTSFSSAGTYKVQAYSQFNGEASWTTFADGATTAFVADSTDMTTTVCANRRPSDELIGLIATFEGFSASTYLDSFTGDPTLGYGVLVFPGEMFYNNLTKTEAYAHLSQSVNNDGYADRVNSFLVGNNIKFNQQQYDALVCFAYNVGTGPFYSDDDLIAALLDCSDGSGSKKTYYINDSYVRIRKGAGTSYDIIKELSYGTTLTVLSTSNSSWYYVQLNDGTKGYVSSDYISSRSTGGNLDFKYINKQKFINNLCQYHHAGGDCVYGLLYRRVDETEMFFYGDYEADYGHYKYPISFTCSKNASFHT